MRRFGLIGKTLKHSFSKNYFTAKFERENIEGCSYELFELAAITELPNLLAKNRGDFGGLNVTIPYKLEIIPYLDELDEQAARINAVNTIKFLPTGKIKGYNTDYYGFRNALSEWNLNDKKALVLGTGGASKAVCKVLEDLGITYQMVSRTTSKDTITYQDLHVNSEWVSNHRLIINTSPVGTYPNISEKPDLPYSILSKNHLLFDLVYNPEMTAFMKEGINAGAQVQNGYDMLVGQAEKSWEIWNE